MIGYHWYRKKANERRKMYSCSSHHFQGKNVCTHNTIPEAPLVECILRIVQQQYLSDQNLRRLREAIQREHRAQRLPVEQLDAVGIERRIQELDRRIDKGAERVFSAPQSLTSTLYTKLEQLRAERDRLRAQLNDAKRQNEGTDPREMKPVDEAVSALRDLRGIFEKADPADCRELLKSVVSRIDLFFDRHRHGKYTRTTFREGLIHVRPDHAFTGLSTTSRRSGCPGCHGLSEPSRPSDLVLFVSSVVDLPRLPRWS